MKKIYDYVVCLLGNIQTKEEQIASTKDEYQVVGFKHELKALNEELENAVSILGVAFNKEQLQGLCKGLIPEDELSLLFNKVDEENANNKQKYLNLQASSLKSNEAALKNFLYNYPEGNNPESDHYTQYTRILQNIEKIKNNINNPNYKKVNIFTLLDPKYFNDFLKKLADNVEDLENKDEIVKNITSFQVSYKSNKTLTYPVSNKISHIVNTMSGVSLDTYFLIKQKQDFINEITAIESNDACNKFQDYTFDISKISEKKDHENFLGGAKDKGVLDLVNEKEFIFKDVRTPEKENRIYNQELKLEFSDNTIILFESLLTEMQFKNMVPEDSKIQEDGDKGYAYTQFLVAKKKFIDIVNSDNINDNELVLALNNLEKETEKIESMMKFIEEKIGVSFDSIPQNVDSFRNELVPRRFKKNLPHNAQISSLYITLSLIQKEGKSIETFLKDPTSFVKDAFEKDFEEIELDNLLKGKDKKEALLELASGKKYPTLDIYGYLRALEFMCSLETDPEKKKNNSLVIAGMLESFARRKGVLDSNSNYISSANINETLQNFFLAEKDDDSNISYSDCHVKAAGNSEFGYVHDFDDFKTGYSAQDKPTTLDKLARYENFENLFYDTIVFIRDFAKELEKPENKNSKIKVKDLVVAAQELCTKFLLVNDIDALNKEYKAYDANFMSKDFYNEVLDFIKNPKSSNILSNLEFDNEVNPNLENIVKNKKSLLATQEKNLKTYTNLKDKAFVNKYIEITRKMDDLDKRVDKISKKLGKGEINSEIEQISIENSKLLNELIKVQNDRIVELQKDYEKGLISKYYFEKRVEQIKTSPKDYLNVTPPQFIVDDPDYKDFKTYKKTYLKQIISTKAITEIKNRSEYDIIGMSEEELKEQYHNIMQKALAEKTNYLANRVLASNGIKSIVAVNTNNNFTIKGELLEIDENYYKTEFENYAHHHNKDLVSKTEILINEVNEEVNFENYIPEEDKEIEKEEKILNVSSL